MYRTPTDMKASKWAHEVDCIYAICSLLVGEHCPPVYSLIQAILFDGLYHGQSVH